MEKKKCKISAVKIGKSRHEVGRRGAKEESGKEY